jgi:nitrite reductase (NADH) small subunit
MVIINAAPNMKTTYNLGNMEQIPLGEGRLFQPGNLPVAVFRARHGEFYATQAWCPHQAGPLADSLIGGGTLVCPLHNFRFDLSTGDPVGNDCGSLQTFPVSVSEAGEILISL